MNKELERLYNILHEINNPITKFLQPGISKNLIEEQLDMQELKKEERFIELYQWKNGVDIGAFFNNSLPYSIFSGGVFLDYVGAFSFYMMEKSSNKYQELLFPLFFSLDGDKIYININKESYNCGKLFSVSPSINLTDQPILIYENLESWVKTIIDCYNKGVYKLLPNGILDIDFEREREISFNLNANCDFWKVDRFS